MSRFRTALLPTLLLMSMASGASAYQDLGLRPSRDFFPRLESGDLDVRERLRRIDALEAELEGLSPEEQRRRTEEAARLYAGSDMIKHRVWATEILGESSGDAPPSLSALRAQGAVYEDFNNPWEARRSYDRMVELYPDSAAAHREQGRLQLHFGLQRFDEESLSAAVASFRRSYRCADGGADDLLGLGAALLGLDRQDRVELIAGMLRERGDEGIGVELFLALAADIAGRPVEAERRVRAVLPRLDASTTDWFESGQEFFESYTPSFLTPSLMDLDLSPPSLVRWWMRLIETEILFGEPDRLVHGWDTACGRVYLRYGRPDRARYYAAGMAEPTLLSIALNLPEKWFVELVGTDILRPFFVWVYRFGDQEIPLIFSMTNAMGRWRATAQTAAMVDQIAEKIPISLPTRENLTGIDLQVRHAAFRAPGEDLRAELYLSLRPHAREGKEPSVGPYRTTLTVLDGDGKLVDRSSSLLDERYRLDRLLPAEDGPDSSIIGQLAVDIAPGRYSMTVEVEDFHTGEYRAHERSFELPAKGEGFELSDLELCHLYAELADASDIPAPFLKYARRVVPLPDERLLPDAQQLGVFYEVYDAAVDSTGRTRLSVIYEIFREQDFHPLDAGLPSGLARHIPVVRTVFSDERTGRSAQGVVVKGTRLGVAHLEPGEYVLAVTLSDDLQRTEARRVVRFRR